jgi:hypothetical protein
MDMLIRFKRRLSAYTVLVFALLTGLAGLVVYFERSLLESWIGSTLLAAPLFAGGIYYVLVRSVLPQGFAPQVAEKARAISPVTPATEAEEEEVAADIAEAAHPLEEEQESARPDPETVVVQVLGLLQRKGRLLDFLQEDIEPYEDAQIGAAVREVHRGCRTALHEALGLAPVLPGEEGAEVEIEEDFDSRRIKLVGNVRGKPPFKGVLRHSGWRYTAVHLPQWTGPDNTDVLAPAEVEIL